MKEKKYTVLLADTDIKSTTYLKEVFEAERIRVFCVASAREVLESVRKWDIDAGIIDAHLKDIEGYKIIPLIKDINKDIKIIMSTSTNSPELESRCREAGIIYYAIKPLDYDEIVKIVFNSFKNHRQLSIKYE